MELRGTKCDNLKSEASESLDARSASRSVPALLERRAASAGAMFD